ncbi:MAG: electron transport complex subunit E [Firmicutes bacterium]|nr:electron transport complex subunit E [Bacillota bacterium]
MSFKSEFNKGIINENPAFRMLLGMCPTLAISLAISNGIGMGLAATFVLVGSNVIISALRKVTPGRIRIPIFIVVIATFVTTVDLIMAAFLPDLHEVLGIFIPLIVVNCIIFARAEAFASQRGIIDSLADGLGMGIGWTLALCGLSAIRELLGTGTLLAIPDFGFAGIRIFSQGLAAVMAILPPGGFITLGLLIGLLNLITNRRKTKRQQV